MQLREASHGEATDARVQAAIDEVAALRVKLDEERAARDKADARAKEERDSLRRRADEEAEQAASILKQARERGDAEETAKLEVIDKLQQVCKVYVRVGSGELFLRMRLEQVAPYRSLSPLWPAMAPAATLPRPQYRAQFCYRWSGSRKRSGLRIR